MTQKDLERIKTAILLKLKAKGWTVNRLAVELDSRYGGNHSSFCSNYLNKGLNATTRNVEKILSVLNIKVK